MQRTSIIVVTAAINADDDVSSSSSSSLKSHGEVVVDLQPDKGEDKHKDDEDKNDEDHEDEDANEDEDEDNEIIINPHLRVMMWLENRALYAENNFYMHPWDDHDENVEDGKEYQYQNGYFFSHRNLKLDVSSNDSNDGDRNGHGTPRIVARQDIPEGTLLVSVPSNTFLYKDNDESKRSNQQLHPCDVAGKVVDVETYFYPRNTNNKQHQYPIPGDENYVKPFMDSIFKLYENSNDDDDDDNDADNDAEENNRKDGDGETTNEHQFLWSDKQIDILSKILGNELEPKSNTLGLFRRSKSNNNNNNKNNETLLLCENPTSSSDQQHQDKTKTTSNKKYHYSYNPTKHSIKKLNLFKCILNAVLTRGWNSRMVPIYHWLPRASDDQQQNTAANVHHSVIEIDESALYEYVIEEREVNIKREIESLSKNGKRYIVPKIDPVSYQLHSSRLIKKDEILILPYHSIAQQFILTGNVNGKSTVPSEAKSVGEKASDPIRFWTQTLHDQTGTDNKYDNNRLDPYDSFLSWDYYPVSGTDGGDSDTKSSRIVWIDKYSEKPMVLSSSKPDQNQEQILRDTQRNVLQSQYMRLRQMEDEIQQQLLLSKDDDDDAAGNLAIYEYYQLWTDSLGLVLAHSRPQRNGNGNGNGSSLPSLASNTTTATTTTSTTTCINDDDNNDDETCSAAAAAAAVVMGYDDLKVRRNGDGINFNGVTLAHDCTNQFEQTLYEETNTPYAKLEWTRSYIGGGRLLINENDDAEDNDDNTNDEREQDTCLHLNGVLHSCLAFRPHVHETLIHYPASFLPKDSIKRVLFVGGGDLVILHEILRYPSIELVIGMELDQTVLRSSFRHYGIQPKFEDERVVSCTIS
jgi:hypothetical protein